MTLPRAEFWRLWTFALVLIVALPTFVAPVHAASGPGSCQASYYARGTRTASGERFNPFGLSAAHRAFTFGTPVRVTYMGRSVIVIVNDRGPDVSTGRCLDLSFGAARALGFVARGVAHVHYEVLR